LSRVVLDASALLAFLLAETGADVVARDLRYARLSAVNYAETLARLGQLGKRLDEAATDIARLQLDIVPFDDAQAVVSASLRAATRELGCRWGTAAAWRWD
jgi:PIN domain nuclease of toxin-antitoxin system